MRLPAFSKEAIPTTTNLRKTRCTASKSADEMTIVEYHRFEGESNPSDMSIVFAIESNDGRRGTLTSSYGAYADHKMLNFISKVRIKETGEFRINKKMAG